MKIIHVLPNFKGGGIQNFLFALAPELQKIGNEVIIIVTDEDNIDYSIHQKKMLENKGITVFNLDRQVGDRLSFLQTIIRARKLFKNINPDIINSHASICHTICSIATMGMASRHCCTIHNAPETWSRMTKIINRNKPLIYCSDSALHLRNQNGKPMIAINNGVDVNKIRVNEIVNLREELKISEKDKVVVLVGSPRPQKNYPFLIKIVERLNNEHIHFCICGGTYKIEREGSNNKNYISLEQFKKYPNIHLLGLRSDVAAILNGSDVYMSCSVREGLPISALEAFFAGIPCVLSPIIQHKTIAESITDCYIPKVFNEDSFIESILNALESKVKHDYIYEQRRNVLQKFSIERCAKEYNIFYHNIFLRNGAIDT